MNKPPETRKLHQTYERILIPITAFFTFLAGLCAARGRTDLLLAMLAIPIAGWLWVVVHKIGERAGTVRIEDE